MGWDSTLMKHTACVGYTDGCFIIVVINQYLSALNNPGLKSWCHFFQPFAALTPTKFVCRNVLDLLQPFLVHKKQHKWWILPIVVILVCTLLTLIHVCLEIINSFWGFHFNKWYIPKYSISFFNFPSERNISEKYIFNFVNSENNIISVGWTGPRYYNIKINSPMY
jgi:hypothetical protein